VDVVRISNEDRQYEKPDNQERNEKTALLQELVKEIPLLLRLLVIRHSERAQRVEESLSAMARVTLERFLDSLQPLRSFRSLLSLFFAPIRR
jgi:hypothetical protein